MNFVMDASAAYVMVTNPRSGAAFREAEIVLAPDLFVPEILNARWKCERAGLTVPTLALMLAFVARIRLVPSIEHATDADALAREWNHPVYDCLYASVAKRADATILTADRRFAAKARNVRVQFIEAA